MSHRLLKWLTLQHKKDYSLKKIDIEVKETEIEKTEMYQGRPKECKITKAVNCRTFVNY